MTKYLESTPFSFSYGSISNSRWDETFSPSKYISAEVTPPSEEQLKASFEEALVASKEAKKEVRRSYVVLHEATKAFKNAFIKGDFEIEQENQYQMGREVTIAKENCLRLSKELKKASDLYVKSIQKRAAAEIDKDLLKHPIVYYDSVQISCNAVKNSYEATHEGVEYDDSQEVYGAVEDALKAAIGVTESLCSSDPRNIHNIHFSSMSLGGVGFWGGYALDNESADIFVKLVYLAAYDAANEVFENQRKVSEIP